MALRIIDLLAAMIGLTAAFPAQAQAVPAASSSGYPGGTWSPGPAQYGVEIVEHVKLTMDDGVILDAAVAFPVDRATGRRAAGRYPVVIEDTPYTVDKIPPNHDGGPVNAYFTTHGYISVRVHSRGTGASGGVHGFWSPREAKDGAAMIQWAAHDLTGSDGRVAIVGCSFPGGHALGDAAQVGPDSPLKAVVAACIALDSVNRHDILVSGVATQDIGFLYNTPQRAMTANAESMKFYRAFGDEIRRGGDAAYDRAFWKQRLPMQAAQQIVDNKVPVLLWTGWEDYVGIGALHTYTAFQNATQHRPIYAPMTADQPASPRYQIIVGDWEHAGGLDNGIVLQWIETWLKGVDTGIGTTTTPMHLFERQTGRWVNTARYPIVERYTAWHLGQKGSLTAASARAQSGERIAWGDPAQAQNRLQYTTPPLAGGATLSGPIAATVYASSSNGNLQLIAELFDVAPDGSAVKISKGAMMGSLRALDAAKSWSDKGGTSVWPWQVLDKDVAMVPGRIYRLDIHMEPTQWGVLPGHRLRLQFTTQAPTASCPGPEKNAPGNMPCYLTDVQKITVPGGTYRIVHGPGFQSTLNLPQQSALALDEAACGVTPTSLGVCLPVDWGK